MEILGLKKYNNWNLKIPEGLSSRFELAEERVTNLKVNNSMQSEEWKGNRMRKWSRTSEKYGISMSTYMWWEHENKKREKKTDSSRNNS